MDELSLVRFFYGRIETCRYFAAVKTLDTQFFAGNLLQWFAWIVLSVILILLVYYALKTFFRREITSSIPVNVRSEPSSADLIESLPFPIVVGEINLLDEARRLYQQGDYAKAIVYLFSYQLVELDKRHIIRLSKGKTNRQYLREIGNRRSLRQLIELTMISFEDAFFGHHTLNQDRFEKSWFNLGEFEKLTQNDIK